MMNTFDEYDAERLKLARKDLYRIFESHFGDPSLRRELNRLSTIIRKIDVLLGTKEGTP